MTSRHRSTGFRAAELLSAAWLAEWPLDPDVRRLIELIAGNSVLMHQRIEARVLLRLERIDSQF